MRIAGIIRTAGVTQEIRHENIPCILYVKPKHSITQIQTLMYDIAPQWSLHLGVGKVKSIVG